MPVRYYTRFWCSKCKEFTIQDDEGCKICGEITESYNLSEVPQDKIMEQRKRYKEQRWNALTSFLKPSRDMFEQLFSEEAEVVINECDAGQKRLDDEAHRIADEERQKIKEEKDFYNTFFKHLQRNDICACGSGLKYKKCCEPKYRKQRF